MVKWISHQSSELTFQVRVLAGASIPEILSCDRISREMLGEAMFRQQAKLRARVAEFPSDGEEISMTIDSDTHHTGFRTMVIKTEKAPKGSFFLPAPGADKKNRTPIFSLATRRFTTKLYPRNPENIVIIQEILVEAIRRN